MLGTLSEQERRAVAYYDRRTREGGLDRTPIWVDRFSGSIFSSVPQGAPVIDVGCGTGRFINLLPELGITNYFGIDPSPANIKYCRWMFPEYAFEQNEIRTVGESYPNRFSGFLLICVLMHIPHEDLQGAVVSLRACLKKGAHGLISTLASLPNRLDRVLTDSDGISVSAFTPEEFFNTFSQNGFRVEQMSVQDGSMLRSHVIAI